MKKNLISNHTEFLLANNCLTPGSFMVVENLD